jgi:hypothetical protein
MIIDEVSTISNGKEIVEILIENIWIPAMATDLRIMNKETELVKVKAIRVRKLEEE